MSATNSRSEEPRADKKRRVSRRMIAEHLARAEAEDGSTEASTDDVDVMEVLLNESAELMGVDDDTVASMFPELADNKEGEQRQVA